MGWSEGRCGCLVRQHPLTTHHHTHPLTTPPHHTLSPYPLWPHTPTGHTTYPPCGQNEWHTPVKTVPSVILCMRSVITNCEPDPLTYLIPLLPMNVSIDCPQLWYWLLQCRERHKGFRLSSHSLSSPDWAFGTHYTINQGDFTFLNIPKRCVDPASCKEAAKHARQMNTD